MDKTFYLMKEIEGILDDVERFLEHNNDQDNSAEIKKLEKEIGSIETEIKEKEAAGGDSGQSRTAKLKDVRGQKREAESELRKVENEIDEVKKEIVLNKDKLSGLEAKFETKSSDLEKKEGRSLALAEADKAKLEKAKEGLTEAEKELADIIDKEDERKKELKQLPREIARAQRQKTALQARRKRQGGRLTLVQRKMLKDVTAKIPRLRAKYRGARRRAKPAEARARKAMSKARGTIALRKAKVAEIELRIKKEEDSAKSDSKQGDVVEKQLPKEQKDLEKKNDRLEGKLEKLERKAIDARQDVQRAVDKERELDFPGSNSQSELFTLKNNLKKLEDKKNQLENRDESDTENRKRKLADVDTAFTKAEHKISAMENDVNLLQRELRELDNDLSADKSPGNRNENYIRNQLYAKKRSLARAQQFLQEKGTEMKKLETKLKDQKEKYGVN